MNKSQTQFAAVVFDQVAETYPTDANVECRFTITGSLEPSKWDWVGLYKVGWTNPNDQYCYKYVPVPSGGEKGHAELMIVFPAKNLPGEDGDFYQFCYMSHQNGISGASTPFQFKKPSAADFVEEEHDGMLFVRPRLTVMNEKIQKLEHDLMMLNQEREGLIDTLSRLQNDLKMRDSQIEKQQLELQEGRANENSLIMARDGLEAKFKEQEQLLHSMNEEKEEVNKRLINSQGDLELLNARIQSLESAIKVLQAEKDELSGQNQSLLNEISSYKEQVTKSQSEAASRVKDIEHLTTMLQQMVDKSVSLEQELKDMKEQDKRTFETLKQQKQELDKMTAVLKDTERCCEGQGNEVQNLKDMLMASESLKQKLIADLKAYDITQCEMNTKLESQESELRNLQERIKKQCERHEGMERNLFDKGHALNTTALSLSATKDQLAETALELKETKSHLDACATELATRDKELRRRKQEFELTKAELKKLAEEKFALTAQLEIFENELKEAIRTKNKEVAARESDLQEKSQQLLEKDKEIELKDAHIAAKDEEIKALNDSLQEKWFLLTEKDEELARNVAAFEECREELQQKVMELKEAQQEIYLLKDEKYVAIEEDQWEQEAWRQKCSQADQKLAEVQEQLHEALTAKQALEEQLKLSKEEEGSKFALWTANESLKVRLEDKERELKELRQGKTRWDLQLAECEREVEDLRERLTMAKEEYTKLLLERNKLQKKVEKEKTLKSAVTSEEQSCCESVSPSDDVAAKQRYKQLYKQEKKEKENRLQLMQAHYHGDLERKGEKIASLVRETEILKQQIENLQEENKCLLDFNLQKDSHIEMLEKKLLSLSLKEQDSQEPVSQPSESAEELKESLQLELYYGNPFSKSLSSWVQETALPHTETDSDATEAKAELAEAEAETKWSSPKFFAAAKAAAGATAKVMATFFRPTTEEDVPLDPMSCAAAEEYELPRPLDPEVMPGAKLAAAKCANSFDLVEEENEQLFEDCSPELPVIDESFMDAIGEGMKTCPICSFNVSMPSLLDEHVANHFGRICPFCKSQADDTMSQKDFELHVNDCIEKLQASRKGTSM